MSDICILHFLGGFQGEVKFQLIYSSGGAIDASAALREVNAICESSIFEFLSCFLFLFDFRF